MNGKTLFINLFILFASSILCISALQAQSESKESTAIKNIPVFSSFKKFSNGIEVELGKGKNLVTIFSLDCEDCTETAKQIGEISKTLKLPPVYFLFLGTEEQVEDFFSVAECYFPYKILDPSTFFTLLDAPYPPRVFLLKEGKITADFKAGNEFTKEKLEFALTH